MVPAHSDKKPEATKFFWKLADGFLSQASVDEGSLMGFPCLRANGEFFCTCEHRSGDLIAKLPKERVQALIAEGIGQPFAPAGRVFKEWVLVEGRDTKQWKGLMTEAQRFVSGD